MRKISKVLIIFLMFFALISVCKTVEANSIEKISMDIFIEENGDAKITEVWECRTNQGTEVYHPYYNLGISEIKDLTVSEGSIKYQTLSSWNTNGTLSSKANKCGINRISNGVELCWGISNYGKHTYTVNYTITNFVSELTDSQMIYWTLIPYEFSSKINSAYIKIYTDFNIEDTIDVWGYGNYGGTAYVYDGYIEMQPPEDGLDKDEYMTILVRFPKGTFNCANKLSNDFLYYLDMADEDAVMYREMENYESIETIIVIGVILCMSFFIFSIAVIIRNMPHHYFDYGPEGKKIPLDVPYVRDIPYHKDIYRSYYIAYRYSLYRNKSDLLGAIILKWLKDGLISIEQKESGFIFKKENTVVVLKQMNPNLIGDIKEKELFKMLYKASKDGYLESKEFEKWCGNSYYIILNWFDEIIGVQDKKLREEGLIKEEDLRMQGGYRRITKKVTPQLRKEAEELAGLKRYLEDYSLIKEREAIEVHLFEEYLIYAQMMGIAKKVIKQFKDLYPELIEKSIYCSYDNIIFIQVCSSNGISEARAAESAAEARASSYSSGGGGFSSGGGGGGSFGGGGGGGGFR